MNLQCDDCKNTDKEVLYCWDCNQLNAKHTTCTKCTVKPIAKEHMCEDCYTEHNEWLKDLVSGTTTVKDRIKIDAGGYFTVYESGAR